MRIMMTVTVPNEPGNRALKDGSFERTMTTFLETHRPEAAYFITQGGDRCALLFVDMKDVSHMVVMAEPFFMNLGARVDWTPAMTPQDLKKGIDQMQAAMAR